MAVRKRGGRYHVEFELKGRRIFRRLPAGATKAQADALDLKLRRELIDQEVLGGAPTVSLEYAIAERYKGTKNRKAELVAKAVTGLPLTRSGIVEAAKRVVAMDRVKKGTQGPFTAATVNRRLSVLKTTAKWAWKKWHWTTENLSPYVIMLDKKLERVGSMHITERQAERLIGACKDPEGRTYIALGCYALMRSGEVVKAKPRDVLRGGLKLPETKGGVPRVVPIIPSLRPYLKALPLKQHPRTLYERFLEARDAVGLRGLVHRDLRRSGATILLNKGVPLEIVADILGDTLEVARKHYAHVLNRTAARAMTKGFRPIKIPSEKRSTRNNRVSA